MFNTHGLVFYSVLFINDVLLIENTVHTWLLDLHARGYFNSWLMSHLESLTHTHVHKHTPAHAHTLSQLQTHTTQTCSTISTFSVTTKNNKKQTIKARVTLGSHSALLLISAIVWFDTKVVSHKGEYAVSTWVISNVVDCSVKAIVNHLKIQFVGYMHVETNRAVNMKS